jgi:hypothetical protein
MVPGILRRMIQNGKRPKPRPSCPQVRKNGGRRFCATVNQQRTRSQCRESTNTFARLMVSMGWLPQLQCHHKTFRGKMSRRFLLLTIAAAAILAAATAFAQQHRPYNEIMKDVGTTFASLKKNLDSNSVAAAAADVTKLQGLFTNLVFRDSKKLCQLSLCPPRGHR